MICSPFYISFWFSFSLFFFRFAITKHIWLDAKLQISQPHSPPNPTQHLLFLFLLNFFCSLGDSSLKTRQPLFFLIKISCLLFILFMGYFCLFLRPQVDDNVSWPMAYALLLSIFCAKCDLCKSNTPFPNVESIPIQSFHHHYFFFSLI